MKNATNSIIFPHSSTEQKSPYDFLVDNEDEEEVKRELQPLANTLAVKKGDPQYSGE